MPWKMRDNGLLKEDTKVRWGGEGAWVIMNDLNMRRTSQQLYISALHLILVLTMLLMLIDSMTYH